MRPVADYLSKALGRDVPLLKDYLDGVNVQPGEVVLFENVRFNKGERKTPMSWRKNTQPCAMSL